MIDEAEILHYLWSLLAFWGLASVYYTATPNAPSSQPGTRGQPGEVTQVDPYPQAGLADGTVAVCNADGSILTVIVLHDTTIETLLFVQQQSAIFITRGELLEESGPGQHDTSGFQQLTPQSIAVTRSTAHSCEGNLEFIRKGLQYY